MSKIEDLLLLSDTEPELFDEYVHSLAETFEEPNELLLKQQFINKEDWVAGYKVFYAYRMVAEKLKKGGEKIYAEVSVFSIFNFLGQIQDNDINLIEEIKLEIADRLKKRA